MKKVVFAIIMFVSFLSFSIYAEEESIFEWGNSNVIVELGEDFQIVLSKVKSKITLKEGYEDPNFYVENNYVNFTTQSTINTNIPGKYKLDHRAVSLKYKKSEVRSFYFHVVDMEAPQVISSQKFVMAFGSNKPNYLGGIIVIDNITPKEQIKIEVDESNIDYNKIGTYQILYTITDEAGNFTLYIENLEIIDLIKPTITVLKPLIHQVGEEFIFDEYFLATDNYDKDLVLEYFFDDDINTLGIKTISILVKDQSGNEETFTGDVEVVDCICPVILLEDESMTLDIGEEFDVFKFVEVSDNYDELTIEDLIVTHNINYELIGSYEVIYELTDYSENKTIKKLNVYIKDQTPPTIIANDIEIKKNQNIDFLLQARVSDNYSKVENISLRIIYNNVNINKPGIYQVTFEAVDESGNHTHKTITINIVGSTTEQKYFYIFLGVGVFVVAIGISFLIVKKRKKPLI